MPDSLDRSISQIQSRSRPTCPAALEANVLRRIRLKEAQQTTPFLTWLCGLLPRPGVMVSALAFAMIVSVLVSFTTARALAADRQIELQRSFGFEPIKQADILPICCCQQTEKRRYDPSVLPIK
jgi:hypothetical protein